MRPAADRIGEATEAPEGAPMTAAAADPTGAPGAVATIVAPGTRG